MLRAPQLFSRVAEVPRILTHSTQALLAVPSWLWLPVSKSGNAFCSPLSTPLWCSGLMKWEIWLYIPANNCVILADYIGSIAVRREEGRDMAIEHRQRTQSLPSHKPAHETERPSAPCFILFKFSSIFLFFGGSRSCSRGTLTPHFIHRLFKMFFIL